MSGRKRSQTKVTNLMKEELLKWLCIQHAINAPLDRNILRQKADELVRNFELTSFKCSESWLTIFLKRYNFPLNLSPGDGPIFEDYNTWTTSIRGLLNQYSYEDQYHLDELTMYTDFVPSSYLQQNEPLDAPVDMSTLKLRLTTPAMHQTTLLLVSNATGTQKQNPLVTAPYPVQHTEKFTFLQTEGSRISNEILSAYLFMFNRKIAESGRRVILFMSRARQNILQLVCLTHVLPVFLPARFPSHLKPLRGDISHFIKMSYRKAYVERLCTPGEAHWTPQEITEALVDAWDRVPKELIVFSFQKTKFREDVSSLTLECPTWEDLQTGVPFERFVTFDDDLGELDGPLMDDFRFLTKVKHEFNLKSSRIEGKGVFGVSEPQPSTSRGFIDVQGCGIETQRPVDDYVDDSEEDGGLGAIGSPVIRKIKIENGIIVTGSSVSQESADEQVQNVEEGVQGVEEHVQEETKTISEPVEDLSKTINLKIDNLSSSDTPEDKSNVGDPARRLFDVEVPKTSDSVDPEVTIESLNSLSRGESTIIEEFDSTIDDSVDKSELITSVDQPFVDSGVPESSEETFEEKMEVDGDEDGPGDTSSPKIQDLSTRKEEMSDKEDDASQMLNPLIDDKNEDNSKEKDVDEVQETSVEGAISTAEPFVDERIEDFVAKPSVDDEKGHNADDDDSINTSEASEAVDDDKNDENLEKIDEIPDLSADKTEIDDKTDQKLPKDAEEIVEMIEILQPIDNIEPQTSNCSLTTSESFDPPQDSSPRPLNSSPVPDYEDKRSYSTESALQEASRELEEKLRDLEASDPSRKLNFFDDEDSKQSNEAASILRDFLNESKEFKGFKDLEDDGNVDYFKGLKRRRGESESSEEPEKKKQMIQDNWAKCFETFPVFGPYNFEDEKKENDGEAFEEEISAQIEVKSNFDGDKGSPGPSCSY